MEEPVPIDFTIVKEGKEKQFHFTVEQLEAMTDEELEWSIAQGCAELNPQQ